MICACLSPRLLPLFRGSSARTRHKVVSFAPQANRVLSGSPSNLSHRLTASETSNVLSCMQTPLSSLICFVYAFGSVCDQRASDGDDEKIVMEYARAALDALGIKYGPTHTGVEMPPR